MLQCAACTPTSKQRPVFDDLPLHFFSSARRRGQADAYLLGLQLSHYRLGQVLPHSADLHTNKQTNKQTQAGKRQYCNSEDG